MPGTITQPFNEPFSSLTAALPSDAAASIIGVAGRAYLMDTSEGSGFGRQGVNVVQQRNTSDNRDLLLLPQDVWRQQVQSWHQGAGQTNMDRDEALPYRYEQSFGIDPWTRYEMTLLNKTAKATGSPTVNKDHFLAVHGGKLVLAVGSTLYFWTTLTSAPATLTVGTSDVISLTYDGDAILTLHSDGKVYRTTNSTTTAQLGATAYTGATFISYVKDYLIIGMANVLKNITGGGAGTTIYTSPVTGFRWLDACEGNSAIYLIGGVNEKWVVHRVKVNSSGTLLEPCVVAASLPDGEIGYSIGSYLGFVFIGTGNGVRMGVQSDADGSLTLGAMIPTTKPVRAFEGQDRFVWFTNSELDSLYSTDPDDVAIFPSSSPVGLGRMDLSTFTVTQATPAYAQDLYAPSSHGETVRSVVTFNGKRVFAVNNLGVFYETDYPVAGGWLKQGTISFSVEDLKTSLYMQAKWQPLSGAIGLDLSFDSSGYAPYTRFEQADSVRSTNISLDGVQFSRVNPRYVLLQPAAVTTRPHLTRWEIRCIPVKGQASRWQLPIMNYDQVEINTVTENRDVRNEFDFLMNLYESGRVFTLQESGRAYQVSAKDFAWKPEKLSANGLGWQGVFMLIVEEVK